MGHLKHDLAEGAAEVRETHISWVFLFADDVYKVKKPVSLGFLDFSNLERRREACEAEVTLNRRLASDVYLGVVPVRRGPDGVHRLVHQDQGAGEGEVVDWAVHMRRLPDRERADVLLEEGHLGVEEVDRMASRIAAFHADARTDEETERFGTPESIAVNVRENFEQTRDTVRRFVSDAEAEEIERWQNGFLSQRADLLQRRVQEGFIRDGHGDLRLEHFYLDGELRVLDCIEFNERFRFADVCADVAFLSMDLAWHGRVDLAERVLATYARDANDYDLYPLVDFYESYRAYVRGKIAAMLALDPEADSRAHERAAGEARRYFRLALAAERRSLLPPMVVAVGGIIASGKSTLAERLGLWMAAPAINTDWVRKHMAGAAPTTKLYEGAWAGAYDPNFTERVYEEVIRRARVVLSSGRPVIVDASFRSPGMRRQVRELALLENVPFRFVECRAEPETCRARLRERELRESVSDGRLEIFDDFLSKWEPITELPPEEHLVVDTERPLEENIESLRTQLPTWPDGLTD